MMEHLIPLLIKFLKFAMVGLSGLIIDFTLTFLLREKLKVNPYVSNTVGFIFAASSNYLFNSVWTFHTTDPNVSVQYSKFIGISLIGLFMNTIILKLLHERLQLDFYLAKLMAIGVVLIWNFTANLFFTF